MSRGGCALSTPFAAFHSGVSLLREKDQEAGKVEHPFHFREFQAGFTASINVAGKSSSWRIWGETLGGQDLDHQFSWKLSTMAHASYRNTET